MEAKLYHIEIGTRDPERSVPFYRHLLEYFEFSVLQAGLDQLGMTNGQLDIWVRKVEGDEPPQAPETGLRHLAFRVGTKDEVDTFYEEFVLRGNIGTLYHAPAHYAEFQEDHYAIFFEDPDRLKLEVVWIDRKNSPSIKVG